MKLSNEQKSALANATKYLGLADSLIALSASDIQPFRASKFINVLGKEVNQLRVELLVFLGEYSFKSFEQTPDFQKKIGSYLILKMMNEESELEANK